ncbi:hypothetical protein [Halosimplex salinum]|nr:hypothetical protein [Halosimplex salinum]
MSDFETYDCDNCDGEFAAHPSARAAETSYCSPRCESVGTGLV